MILSKNQINQYLLQLCMYVLYLQLMQKQINISLHKKPKIWVRHQNLIKPLPITQQKKEQFIKKMRESLWDGRFYVDKMDQYNRKPKFSLREKLQSIQVNHKPIATGPLRDKALFRTVKNQEKILPEIHKSIESLSQGNQSIKSLKIDREIPVFELKLTLKKIWQQFNIPMNHRNLFLQGLEKNSLKKARKFIVKEIKNIRSKKALIILTRRTILARENSIAKISEIIKENAKPVNFESLDTKIKGYIRDYQQLSTLAIQNIVNWRIPLEKLFRADKSNHYHISFDFNGQNYLVKIRHDSTQITEWLGLPKQDIFLIGLQLKSSSIVRIRASELMLIEEAMIQNIDGKTICKLG